jgi:hypothetical protein
LLYWPNSVAWRNAAGELARVSKECVNLALRQGDPDIIDIATTAAARVKTQCPVEAEKAGL